MMRSLFAGVSGLRNHQTRMDVIGNNIANVNTVGFKASRVQFQDVLSQTLQGAASGQGDLGGTNPIQVGLGMGVASIDTIFTDGSYQPTGKQTDLSIQGQGFFVLSDGLNQVYTRSGNFDFDSSGNYLVPGSGYKVMGWSADSTGAISTAGSISTIRIPVGESMNALASTQLNYAYNLSSGDAVGKTAQTSLDVYDSQGVNHSVSQTFIKTNGNTWLVKSTVPDAVSGSVTGDLREIVFDSKGLVASINNVAPTAGSSTLTFASPLKLNNTNGSTEESNFTVFDSTTGMPHTFKMSFTYSSATSQWSYSVTDPSSTSASSVASGTVSWAAATPPATGGQYQFASTTSPTATFTYGGATYTMNLGASGTDPATAPSGFSFNPASNYATTAAANLAFTPAPQPGASAMNISLGLDKLTQFGGTSTVQATEQNGYAAGTLSSVSIDPSGIVVGRFTNGKSKNMAQVCLATFNNAAGLNKVGDNLFAVSNNSGVAQIGPSGSGGRGKFNPGTLEMSNVDLAQEFSNMIITERGFQANSKIISTDDEMLQELANLKR